MSQDNSTTMRHITSLDGVRALAIALVMAVHYHALLGGGWIGVWLFFVLSGFLITRILVDAKTNADTFGSYLKTFLVRRALRIFPLFMLFMLIGEVLWQLTSLPQTWPIARPWLFTYTLNFGHMLDLVPISDVYSHFWSLAVEEQFYLLWPVVIWFLNKNTLRAAILLMLVGAPIARWLLIETHILELRQLYFFTPTLLDSFAAGAAVALFDLQWIKQIRWWVLGTATFTLAAGIAANLSEGWRFALWSFGYPYHMPSALQYVWGYTLLNLTSGLLILACMRDQIKIFNNRYLVRVGKISYGLYIIHRPVFRLVVAAHPWLASHLTPSLVRLVGVTAFIVVSLLLAKLSYHYFELRFLNLKGNFKYR